MALTAMANGSVCVREIGGVRAYFTAQDGTVDPEQLAAADVLERDFAQLVARAKSYLDLFVDRARACGDAGEDWWLDEIEFRSAHGRDFTYAFQLRLTGDDDGFWAVGVAARGTEHRPVMFERVQG